MHRDYMHCMYWYYVSMITCTLYCQVTEAVVEWKWWRDHNRFHCNALLFYPRCQRIVPGKFSSSVSIYWIIMEQMPPKISNEIIRIRQWIVIYWYNRILNSYGIEDGIPWTEWLNIAIWMQFLNDDDGDLDRSWYHHRESLIQTMMRIVGKKNEIWHEFRWFIKIMRCDAMTYVILSGLWVGNRAYNP